MHRVVWEHHNGPIPAGCHIHHINGDKSDNSLENLECLGASEHMRHRSAERNATPEGLSKSLAALDLARPKAAEWHGSEAGRKWHSENGKRAWESRERVELQCSHCTKPYFGFAELVKRGFCSPSCQGADRVKSGVDDETRCCSECGGEFRVNKYRKTRTCGKACWKAALGRTKRQGLRPDGA
ncbi:HNH endonuclease signature motif containing protein [Acidovorax sp.]|uniref:HNH endonuclease signature motif containing protein n=1 Tax=Acidovorax sp. TaxID=1872122 RepID=UPI00344F8A4F